MNDNKFFDKHIIYLIKNMNQKHKIYYCNVNCKKQLIAICDENNKIKINPREFEKVKETLSNEKNFQTSWIELHFNDFDQYNEIDFEIRIISISNIKKFLKECSDGEYSDNESCYDKIFKYFIISQNLSMYLLLKNKKEIIRLLQIDKINNTYELYKNFDDMLTIIKKNSDDTSKMIRRVVSNDSNNNYLILNINNNASHYLEIYNIFKKIKY